MNKKLITALVAIITLIPTAANAAAKNMLSNKADTQPVIAILDTALDTSLSMFKDKVVYEVCMTEWSGCPNRTNFQEGPGAAYLPSPTILNNGFDHGTQIASLAVATNPNIKFVFIRIIGSSAIGLRQPAGEATLYNALDWVIANKDKFNIQAVSMSQGNHSLLAGTDYCPKTPKSEARINTLLGYGIPVFVPTGNIRDYSRIDWPACIPSAIAVGATMPTNEVAIYSNFDPILTDFFALGTTKATNPGGNVVNVAGTSAATIIAATQWATVKSAKPTYTFQQIYDLIVKTSIPTKNSKVSGGKLINLNGALNG